MKRVFVMFSFHAHEPLWDLARHLTASSADQRIADAVLPENYVRRRLAEGRNVYRDLLEFLHAIGAPGCLDITNELLYQLWRQTPSTVEQLGRAFSDGTLSLLYTLAHHTHPTLLSPDDLQDEIRLNRELCRELLGVSPRGKQGLFPTECSLEARHITAIEAASIDYVICPQLDLGDTELLHRPLRLGNHLVGLPRHFAVSQEIWRPLTLAHPDRVKYQGFLVGQSPVFAEEYLVGRAQTRTTVDAADEYFEVLRGAIADAPPDGLLLYVQDLELMDFGEQALEVMTTAWSRVLADAPAEIDFVTPERYLAMHDPKRLPRIDIRQASWAPELRPALRSDGHYPPHGVGKHRGFDAAAMFRRWPFVFWEAGRFMTTLLDWMVARFGYDSKIASPARTLVELDYRVDRLPPHVRLPLLCRLAKRACNHGWYPEEGMSKRTFLDAHLVADALALELRLGGRAPHLDARLPAWTFPAISKLSQLLVTPRIEYLTFGLSRWREEGRGDPRASLLELERAKAHVRSSQVELEAAEHAYLRLEPAPESWLALCSRVSEYSKNTFLALDHVQRAWMQADAEFLIVPMYRYLADVYPPKLPGLLDWLQETHGFSPTTPRATFTTAGRKPL